MSDVAKPSDGPANAAGPELSIIVPTYKERENICELTTRIFQVVNEARITTELILVDDNSADGSMEVVAELQAEHAVRMIVRTTERGLSTAVLRGFQESSGQVLLVMDADLSHPPEKIPALYEPIATRQADFIIGSRYTAGGQTTEDWGLLRKINSLGATWLARPLTAAKDPMAGFFCLRRKTWQDAAALNPLGYKIGLELMVKARCSNIKEVPIVFQDRHAGKSKMTFRQQLLYLLHLKRLYAFAYPLGSFLLFYIVPVLVLAAAVWLIVRLALATGR